MVEMTQQVTSNWAGNSRRRWLFKIGGASALITGTLLLAGMISLIVSVLLSTTTSGWLSQSGNNWLVRIFILHAEIRDMHVDLHGTNLLDIIILFLVSVICLSISSFFKNSGRVWSLIAFALSVIAIILYLTTQIAGRSAVMLVVLINSFVMMKYRTFSKVTIYSGILASVFLFIGDLTVGIHSVMITALFGIGYVLLTTWFFLMARSLFRAGTMP